jgi:2-octaprenyl-6-methoxyphenol hydroxylase
VIGAGPVGLALALLAARSGADFEVTVFDARAADKDVSADPRALALSLGSVQLLQRLGAWPQALAQPITEVHVSQAPPTLSAVLATPEVRIRAAEEGVPMLGAVLRYGQVVTPLQQAWEAECARRPDACRMRFGTPVAALKPLDGGPGLHGVEVDAGIAEGFDLAVIAEGGVFADQARKGLTHDYRQTAWVGTVTLGDALPGAAFERFTRQGPVALLPLQPGAQGERQAALVWCVPTDDDPVAPLDAEQRRGVLATLLSPQAGRLLALGPLKSFALGLNAERSLVEGRQVRIGNAAQTLHPVAGQGLNLGLRDAFVLVDTLARSQGARSGPRSERTREQASQALDQALRRIEWARAGDRWSMIAATDFLARSFTWQWPGFGALRGLGLAGLQAVPPLKSLLARRMMFGGR